MADTLKAIEGSTKDLVSSKSIKEEQEKAKILQKEKNELETKLKVV